MPLLSAILLLFACFGGLAAGEAGSDEITVPMVPFGLLAQDAVTGLDEAGAVGIDLNLPLLRRIVVGPDDVRQVTLAVVCRQVGPRLTALANGGGAEGAVDLATEPGLRRIPLAAGETIAFTAWKQDAHFHGRATLTGLRVVRLDAPGGEQVEELPLAVAGSGSAAGRLGTYAAIGIASRDRLPVVRAQVAMQAGGAAGTFVVPGSRGARLEIVKGVVTLASQGRADADASYDWAPALAFTAGEPGLYAVAGTLAVTAAKPGQRVAWMIGRLDLSGPSLAGAELIWRLRDTDPARVSGLAGRLRLVAGANGQVTPANLDLSHAAAGWLARPDATATLSLALSGADGRSLRGLIEANPTGAVRLASRPKALLFTNPIVPREGVYATMRDGRLQYGDERLRLWGMVKDGSGERIRQLGFNSVRVWFQDSFYTPESAKRGRVMEYVPGDGSKLDRYDRMMADYRRNGLFVMLATTVGSGTGKIPIDLMASDDSWLAGGDDWRAWKEAVRQVKNLDGFGYLDERLWRIRLRHAENVLDHRNPYTGKRYAEEESIALIEVNNEAGLAKRWLEGGFAAWPDYFRAKLVARWNEWLARRYPDPADLLAAWGRLDPDEAPGAVKPEPILANRNRYPRARQQDLLRFVCDLIDGRNQEYRTFCRGLAPNGVGVNVVPFSFDSQYQPNTLWTYGNRLGDTSTVSMYFWRHDSMLTSPPGLYVLDSTRSADRLAVIYETQRARPSPCRGEYPYLLAAMTSWQDFDVVMWHGSWIGGRSPEELLAGTVPPPTKSHFWSGVHLEHDPVMSAAIAMAGRVYLAGTPGVAPRPATYRLGADAIFSYDVWNGLGGRAMSMDTFTRGSRLVFAPDEPGGVSVDGVPLIDRPAAPPATGPVATGPQVTWDWPNGRLIIDAPTTKVLVGRTPASHRFADGIILSGLERPFTVFALISADGRPLCGAEASRRMLVSSGGDARNTGADFDFSVPGGPLEQAKAVRSLGHAPVVVDPAGFTLAFPTPISGTFTAYDFALREILRLPLADASALRQPGQTWWMGELAIASRGPAAEPPCDQSPGATTAAIALPAGSERSDPALAAIPHPIPGLAWGDNYAFAHRALRDSPLTKTAVSPFAVGGGTISVSELDGVWGQPANVDLAFVGDRMRSIAVTFTQAPAFSDLLDGLRREHGTPVREALVGVASEQSEVRWRLPGGVGLIATEVQGVVRLVYELEPAR